MAKIYGKISNIKGEKLENAEVLFIDFANNLLASAYSDKDGYYYIQMENNMYGMIYASYNYPEESLGFWFQNISTSKPHNIDITIGNVEFLNFIENRNKDLDSKIKYNFQLISKESLKDKKVNLSPEFKRNYISLKINDKVFTEYILIKNQVKENYNIIDYEIDNYELLLNIDKRKYEGSILSIKYKHDNQYGVIKRYI